MIGQEKHLSSYPACIRPLLVEFCDIWLPFLSFHVASFPTLLCAGMGIFIQLQNILVLSVMVIQNLYRIYVLTLYRDFWVPWSNIQALGDPQSNTCSLCFLSLLEHLATFITMMVKSLHASVELTPGIIKPEKKMCHHSPVSDTSCVRVCQK